MVWQHILGWVILWGLFFTGLIISQIVIFAHYSWKETKDPKSYFKEDTLGAIQRLWRRNRVLWTFYFATLLLSITIIFAVSSITLGAPDYAGWFIGLVGFAATEIGLYKTRRFLHKILWVRNPTKYWKEMELPHMFKIRTYPFFALPFLVIFLFLQRFAASG